MSFRQRRRNGLFRVSWGTCLLLSVLAHLFLLAGSCLVPEEWLASPRPAEAARRKVAVSARMVKKVEPQLERRRQEPAEYLPAVVKTNEEQESATRPEVPKFQSNRNTRAEGGRKDPDGDRDMPAQDGVERENGEIVLFNQERQDGDLSHERDGNKNASPGASSNVPYQPLEPSMPPAGHPGSLAHSPVKKGEPGKSEEEKTARQNIRHAQEKAMQLPHAVVLPSPGDSEKPDPLEELAKSIAKGADNPPLNLPNLDLVPNTKPVQKQPLYDPMFNAESQPGFKTHERKTKQAGKFSFGRRPTLDVEATPMGTYQAIVYRAIGEQWYRQCDLNRDLIVTGTVRIRILINKNGKVSSMRQTSRVGASEVQKSFTFLAIKLARLPAMPPEVRSMLVGDSLEMYFDFNF